MKIWILLHGQNWYVAKGVSKMRNAYCTKDSQWGQLQGEMTTRIPNICHRGNRGRNWWWKYRNRTCCRCRSNGNRTRWWSNNRTNWSGLAGTVTDSSGLPGTVSGLAGKVTDLSGLDYVTLIEKVIGLAAPRGSLIRARDSGGMVTTVHIFRGVLHFQKCRRWLWKFCWKVRNL